jgi:hypothetical protein
MLYDKYMPYTFYMKTHKPKFLTAISSTNIITFIVAVKTCYEMGPVMIFWGKNVKYSENF